MSVVFAAIPVFVALVLAELTWDRICGRRVHRVADSLTDIGCATMSQVVGLAVTAVTVGGYAVAADWIARVLPVPAWFTERPLLSVGGAPALAPGALLGWVTVFLLVDLGQYLVHRLSHRVSILWACHVVHHSSEELNYAVGLRNSSFHGFLVWVFFLPLAVVGIPWRMVAVCYGLNLLYQF